MNGDGISTCIHCGRTVVKVESVIDPNDPYWVHQNSGLMLCEQTAATPVLTETPAVLTGQVSFPETTYRGGDICFCDQNPCVCDGSE